MRIFNTILSLSAVMIFIIGVYTIGPWVETNYFPVYSKFAIQTMRPLPGGGTEVVARYTKFRNCPALGSAWYLNPLNRGSPVTQLQMIPKVTNAVPFVNRPVGTYLSAPIELDTTPGDIVARVIAEVYSKCHPLWVTRTVIFP